MDILSSVVDEIQVCDGAKKKRSTSVGGGLTENFVCVCVSVLC